MVSAVTDRSKRQVSSATGVFVSSYATLASRIVLGGVFLVAGATKIADPGGLAASIRSYELPLPEWFVSASAYSLPYLEVLLGLFTKVSAWATNGLIVLFTLALAQGALRGLEIDCGCFGSSAGGESNLWLDAARDVGLLALGIHIALAPPSRYSIDARLRQRG
jgi:putative oxidoreductase